MSISYDDNHYTTGISKVTVIPIVIGALGESPMVGTGTGEA